MRQKARTINPERQEEGGLLSLHAGELLYKILLIVYDRGLQGLKFISKKRRDGLFDGVVYFGQLHKDGSHKTKRNIKYRQGMNKFECEQSIQMLLELTTLLPSAKIQLQDYSGFTSFEEQMEFMRKKDTGIITAIDEMTQAEFVLLPNSQDAKRFLDLGDAFEYFHAVLSTGNKSRIIRLKDAVTMPYRVIRLAEQ